jgi:ParB family transcriptional regulator, chromosome partitioning protein
MTTTTSIALKNLTLWKGNVRKTNAGEGIGELAASIKATGLIQSLAVIPHGKNFAVVAGGRRLAALQLLQSQGDIDADYGVSCNMLEDERALEASLAENAMRSAMHPADQFEAFRGLADQGMTLTDIAARFGVTDRIVEQRLKLARVAPSILKAYRSGETDLECVMAFAVTDDAKAQVRMWKSLSAHHRRDADHIRSALTEGDIDAADRRVRFVTLEAYESAGGPTRRDLFTEGENGVFILQPDLLNELVGQKVEHALSELAAEGWAWSEFRDDFDYAERSKFRRIHEEAQDLPADLQTEMQSLEEARERLYDGDDEDLSARLDEIDERLEAIEAQRQHQWPEGTLESAGAVATIDYNGHIVITRGLVRPEDVKGGATAKPKDPGALPKSLGRALRAQHSAALSAEVAARPEVALASIVHALACDAFLPGENSGNCLRISSSPGMPEDDSSQACRVLEQARTLWANRLPSTGEELWDWCTAQQQSTLLELLAFCTALSVNTVTFEDRYLAKAVALDMRNWFTPTATNYFGNVSKTQIIEALTEAKGTAAPAWGKAKKGELAAIAERELNGSGWLPAMLRTAA